MTEIAADDPETCSAPMTDKGHDTLGKAFRCRLCGDVIGVYEPIVACTSDGLRTTSRAAEPTLDPGDTYYHGRCFARHGERRR